MSTHAHTRSCSAHRRDALQVDEQTPHIPDYTPRRSEYTPCWCAPLRWVEVTYFPTFTRSQTTAYTTST